VHLGFAIELFPQDAALGPDGTSPHVDVNAFHRGQVDQQPMIERGVPRNIVAAAANGDVQAHGSCQRHRIDDIGDAVTARDRRRALVDQAVVHPSPAVIAGVGGLNQLSCE